ncbi:MAG: lytic transglycosylase [Bacteroidetes bacterium HGW-Bacteroidetes-17]|jgi:membrane-bound lytic murein transglycosylase D|nr:MAG: lytic transglycosylase [Bacteroidetes bacterium HGW-Bacteroidetes-17]
MKHPYRNISLRLFALSFFLFISISNYGQSIDTTKVDLIEEELVEDSTLVIMLDSLINVKYFTNNFLNENAEILNVYNYAPEFVPSYSDSIYEARIAYLNAQTPIELTYNKNVKNYIQLYGERKRGLTQRLLGLAKIYFPYFEEKLDLYNIPLELKYLAIVESALIPNAGSRVGAKGLWQFMYGTGKVYGLTVSSYVDDRFDPMKSTIAACEHLEDLYDIYGDWSLVLAAYNSGAGNVNRAIRRAGGIKNYWAIWPFLPRETRDYVPAFIAVNYIMNFAAEHNLYPVDPGILYQGIDTVTVKDVLSFDQISEFLKVPMEDIQFLNPQFKLGVIPATNGERYTLRLPKDYIYTYLENEDSLYNFKTEKGIEREKLMTQIASVADRNIHIVRSGENLGTIAKQYRCNVTQLKQWNSLKSNTIFPGQKLILYGSGAVLASNKQTVVRSNEQSVHYVKSGENLGLIATKYKCSITDLKEWNNLKSSTIQPNQKLIVYKPDGGNALTANTSGKYLYHTIKSGDTLWDIAKMYDGVTVDKIKALNNIQNTKRLEPGKKLKIAIIG